MSDFHFSVEDAALILTALEYCKSLDLPVSVMKRLDFLQTRIVNADPRLTSVDLDNICVGLEMMVEENPLDWKAAQLLSRLQSLLEKGASQSEPQ